MFQSPGHPLSKLVFADRGRTVFTRGANISNRYFTVGIAEYMAPNKWYVYPNPASDRLFIGEISHIKYPLRAVVNDLQGRRMLENTTTPGATQQGIELSQLPNGLYVLQLNPAKGWMQTLRFVKNRSAPKTWPKVEPKRCSSWLVKFQKTQANSRGFP